MANDKPFHLQGNFAPVTDEVTASDLDVHGSIPPELNGLYVRNGANPVTGKSAHWFLGQGMVHGIRIENGQAKWYRNRYVQTPYLHDPAISRISPDGVIDRTASAANTHIISHAGKILALEEGSFPYELTPELDTVGPDDYQGKLKTAFTAHPKICPITGELLFFGYGQLPPYLVYHRVSPEGKLIQSEEITVGGPTMMHDFQVTESYALFMDLPVVFDLQLAMQGTMPFHWSDDYPARVGIMPRDGSDADVKWFSVDPCYVFHPLNAFEHNGSVVFDVCRISELWRDPTQFAGGGKQSLHRWTFDLASGTTKEETLDDRSQDFPRVADARVGQKHRFGFTTCLQAADDGGLGAAGLLKHDFERGSATAHDFGPGCRPGEAVFVPGAGSDPDSDEGWAMTYVHDETSGKSEFVILDASRFDAEPVARVSLPQRVPYGFHGSWISDTD